MQNKGDYVSAINSLCNEIQRQFIKYDFIADSGKLNERDNKSFKEVLNSDKRDEMIFKEAVQLLSSCLKQYYRVNTIILIDEYDVPLESAYFNGYYDEMVSFIRSLFVSALKTNSALEFSVITGCLRISKESIFTGLNNLRTNTILSAKYSSQFGFT